VLEWLNTERIKITRNEAQNQYRVLRESCQDALHMTDEDIANIMSGRNNPLRQLEMKLSAQLQGMESRRKAKQKIKDERHERWKQLEGDDNFKFFAGFVSEKSLDKIDRKGAYKLAWEEYDLDLQFQDIDRLMEQVTRSETNQSNEEKLLPKEAWKGFARELWGIKQFRKRLQCLTQVSGAAGGVCGAVIVLSQQKNLLQNLLCVVQMQLAFVFATLAGIMAGMQHFGSGPGKIVKTTSVSRCCARCYWIAVSFVKGILAGLFSKSIIEVFHTIKEHVQK